VTEFDFGSGESFWHHVPAPEYLDIAGRERKPSAIEAEVQGLFALHPDCIRRFTGMEGVAPPIYDFEEMVGDVRIRGEQHRAIITRKIEQNGTLSEIALCGLQGDMQGAIWTDASGKLWHSPRLQGDRRYPLLKIPLLINRLRRVQPISFTPSDCDGPEYYP
jgi:hypothetical protein